MSEEIRLEVKEGWALLVVDRPKQFNAFNTGIVEEMDRLLDQVEANKDIRCLVITGSGEKSFISGADIGQMGSDGYTPADAHYLITCGYKVYNRVESLNIPVIAAVNGYCLGGGLELAMCCDIRICSANAKFALPEINLGIIPGWGGTIRLPRIIGEGRAKDMIYRGKKIDSATALNYGLVTEVYEDVASLRAGAEALAAEQGAHHHGDGQKDGEPFHVHAQRSVGFPVPVLLLYNPGFTGRDFGLSGEAARQI